MTTREAAEKFNLEIQEVRKRKNDGMIPGARTVKGRIVIPDDIEILPSKQEIQSFLFEIIKYKNNPNVTISREYCPDEISLHSVVNYVYRRGFVGEFEFNSKIQILFQNLSLTDEGLKFIMKRMSQSNLGSVEINSNINFGIFNKG